jgi:uncharacterized protein (UPF0333 family)
MLCAKCGQEIEEGTKFCRFCGAPATPAVDPEAVTERIPTVDPDAVTVMIPPVVPVVAPIAPPVPAPATESWDPSQSWKRPEPPRRRAGMWAFVAGVVFVVCAGVVVAAYFLLRDDSGSASTASTESAVSTTAGSTDSAVSTTAGEGTTVSDGGSTETTIGEGTTTSAEASTAVDLTARADINVSSTLATQGSTTYDKANLIDRDPTTCWAEGVAGYGIGEFIQFNFAAPVTVAQIRIVPGYDKTAGGWDRWTSNGRVRSFDLSYSDGTTESYSVTDSRELQIIALSAPHTVTSVRLTITGVYEAAEGPKKAEDTSVSELHFWGTE